VLADDTVDAVRGLVGVHRVSLTAAGVPSLPGVVSTEETDGRIHLLTTDADELVRALVRSGHTFSGLEIRPTTLEEAFLSLMTTSGEPAKPTDPAQPGEPQPGEPKTGDPQPGDPKTGEPALSASTPSAI
jgi:ABC-2 type transport system ATP-binding protein